MAGNTLFPTALDSDSELFDVSNNVTAIDAAHHNNMKESIKAIEKKIGIDFTSVATSLDYRLGHPTNSHRHDGASGQGQKVAVADIAGINLSGLLIPLPSSGAEVLQFPSGMEELHAPAGPTYAIQENTLLRLGLDGEVYLSGWDYMEFTLNAYNPGGPVYYTKHYLFGGWGMVLPAIATSAIHATYSEVGQMFYDNANNKVRVRAGATWRSVAFE